MSGSYLSTREVVRLQREAYVRGVLDTSSVARDVAAKWADDAFPTPKVTRFRIADDPHDAAISWRIAPAGQYVEHRFGGEGARWQTGFPVGCTLTDKRSAVIADLFANPTEEVEA